ncbi:SGNH/GDSL hydrolase family protein [Schlesneria sp.]|uniref:SGNH/GDSL hydrolase family protein n=1 Tax=Schlesneria sp. TaxID=2762018 RepID=UPI002EF36F0A
MGRCSVGYVLLQSITLLAMGSLATAKDSPPKLELQDGDRVVFLGGTFIEREGQFGYLETALTTAWPDRKVTFRNLGWSGDTVWAESRGIFDPPQVGYQRMIELITLLKPTLVVMGYGQNESFAGEAGVGKFVAQYEKLCNDVQATGARLAFMTPHKWERPKSPLPDASRQNGTLAIYAAAVRDLAARRSAPVIDLFELPKPTANLTENGLHFGPFGYSQLVTAIQIQQGWPRLSPSDEKGELIRQKVVEKNMQFFHRWRPQNITYLTGFRKHEQGNNAVEIAQFDPIVARIEGEISELNSK